MSLKYSIFVSAKDRVIVPELGQNLILDENTKLSEVLRFYLIFENLVSLIRSILRPFPIKTHNKHENISPTDQPSY